MDRLALTGGARVHQAPATHVESQPTDLSREQSVHVGPVQGVEDLGPVTSLALLPASPNPFFPTTTLGFALPSSGTVRLTVLDLAGRTVRTIAEGNLRGGRHAYIWDGRDDAGHSLPNGLYFTRLETEQGAMSRKVVLTK